MLFYNTKAYLEQKLHVFEDAVAHKIPGHTIKCTSVSASTTLFSIVTDNVLKQLDLKGNISTRIKQCSAYADDILLTTRTIMLSKIPSKN
jgi:hypothetical protein